MTIHRVEQGSEEWKALRCGKVTASRVGDVCAKLKKGGWAAPRGKYLDELTIERLGVKTAARYLGMDVETGKIREPEARVEYELRNRCEVVQIGFVDHPTIPMTGASPDGMVKDRGLIEIKCPSPATHLEYLSGRIVPEEYEMQIVWAFACNPDREWCDFVSFNPDFPVEMELFQVRTFRDYAKVIEVEAIVRTFLTELDRKVADLLAIYVNRSAAA